MDLLTTFYSLYNSAMKLFYIISSVVILVIMGFDPVRSTLREEHDIKRTSSFLFLFLPTFLVSIGFFYLADGFKHFDVHHILWLCSIMLESISLVPQVIMFRRYRHVEHLTGGSFLLMMGSYRLLYIFNWLYINLNYEHNWPVYILGAIQFCVGVGGMFCCVGNTNSQPIMPQVRQMFKDIKFGWFAVFFVLMEFAIHGDVVQDMYYTSKPDDQKKVAAFVTLAVVSVLGFLICCGFKTEKEVKASAAESKEFLHKAPPEEKYVKTGIFIHGVQVV